MTQQQQNNVSNEWRETTVGEFAHLAYGKSLRSKDRNTAGNVPVFGSNGIVGYHDTALTDGPTVIIGRKGTAGAVHYSPVPCWPIDTTFFITGDDPHLIRFKHYALGSIGLPDMNTDSAVPGLNRNAAHARELRIPPLAEQRRIAEILGTLDDKIELNRRMNETLDEMARAIFKDWFVDFGPVRAKMEGRDPYLPDEMWKLFPDKLADSELGEIPEGWETKRLGDIALLNPESWKKSTAPLEIEYVELANTKWGVIKSTKHFLYENAPSSAKRVLRVGDTIVGTVRPGNGSYSIVGREGLTGSTGFAVMRPKEQMYQEFVYLVATNPSNIERMSHHADGTTYPTIRPDFVAETKATLPWKRSNVMACFSSMTAPMFNRMEANLTESRTLAAMRDTLLPKLVSGEIRV